MVDAAIFWAVDRWDAFKDRWLPIFFDASRDKEYAEIDQALDLHEELDRILKAQEGRST
jgi:hypothetical protein